MLAVRLLGGTDLSPKELEAEENSVFVPLTGNVMATRLQVFAFPCFGAAEMVIRSPHPKLTTKRER
jgi:hypothetical protein